MDRNCSLTGKIHHPISDTSRLETVGRFLTKSLSSSLTQFIPSQREVISILRKKNHHFIQSYVLEFISHLSSVVNLFLL